MGLEKNQSNVWMIAKREGENEKKGGKAHK